MNTQNSIPTFIISLPKDAHRREQLGKQLQDLALPFSVIQAVHGKSLSSEELDASYDRDKAIALFNRELSKGEIGCALSHLSIYRKMVEEDIPYALILEDDARILDEDLPATLSKLAQCHAAQAPVAVLLNHVMRYDGSTKIQLDDSRCLYEAYRGVNAHAYFITKAAAEILVRNLYPVYVVADKWEYFQEQYFPVTAMVPYPIGLAPVCLSSSIDAMGKRVKKIGNGRNYKYYLRKYLNQLKFLIMSRPFIRLEHQRVHELDSQPFQ
ncbi:glycosyltransferase family 25 protein [Massilia norwichensis]|uniref:Glycosyltransferase family 25 protein n=1 Tax=Massilia norwichensis TaxID=1442366 RepID=A0ABT2A8Q1_9BURK|nr:glycosyltransferase family 25 protein [Massilia norwichensis]MCS0590472.1 glycosyltransferase family 25 protein [Massilia norwichensis]